MQGVYRNKICFSLVTIFSSVFLANCSNTLEPGIYKTPEGRRVILTPAPAAKEVVLVPKGYGHCIRVSAGWQGNTWVPAHRVCQYEKKINKKIWVEGYWKCENYNPDQGKCYNWDWVPSHWAKTTVSYDVSSE